MFAVRSLPRLSARAVLPSPSMMALAPAQRSASVLANIKQLLGVVPELTPEERKAVEAERIPLMQGPGAQLGTVSYTKISLEWAWSGPLCWDDELTFDCDGLMMGAGFVWVLVSVVGPDRLRAGDRYRAIPDARKRESNHSILTLI